MAGTLVVPASASAKTYIGKPEVMGYETFRVMRPSYLPVYGPTQSIADSIFLKRIRWSRWGGDTARATARIRQKTYDPWRHVRVRAYRVARCQAVQSFRLYTRLRVSGLDYRGEPWAHTWKTPSCPIVMGWMD
jgi:hypothetical protein